MRIQQLLDHHGIVSNPFSDEDAQTDLVFKGYCITHTYHPAWDKIHGNPSEPATAIVFGEKGSGKTALRLQLVRHLADYNADHPGSRALVIEYADFNPFLDRFRERFHGRRRKIERVLDHWKLWDHMDAVLSLGVTQLVDRILEVRQTSHPAACDAAPLPIGSLDRSQARDLLLLAACYDGSTAGGSDDRWNRLRRKLGFPTWKTKWDLVLPVVVAAALAGAMAWCGHWDWLKTVWPYLALVASFLPRLWRCAKAWRAAWSVARNTRVLATNRRRLKRIFTRLPDRQWSGQPLPRAQRSDDRYELLSKLQNVAGSLGLSGMIVLVDRVDEPYLINGSSELMRAMVWPLLDNKLLKHPGLGFKVLLPAELLHFVDRETSDFHQRARLDKQNLIRSLQWTGESLLDLANARLAACAAEGRRPTLRDLLDEGITDGRLLDAMRSLRVPRHLFKFLYQAMVAHTNAHTDAAPQWRIRPDTFESTLALYQRDQAAFDRGVGTV
ncbi:MAG TPA: hypothetical protein VJL29_11045 [Thermoguttaceae bacterium]|nr:hypothetical protein [Thermoguttaceae bacterium]